MFESDILLRDRKLTSLKKIWQNESEIGYTQLSWEQHRKEKLFKSNVEELVSLFSLWKVVEFLCDFMQLCPG